MGAGSPALIDDQLKVNVGPDLAYVPRPENPIDHESSAGADTALGKGGGEIAV